MKIRIFALAKELDMDSKVLIDLCNRAGITVKNSPLASISPEQKELVLSLIAGESDAATPAAPDGPTLAPQREDVPEVTGKVREIKNMVARPQPARLRPAETAPTPAVEEAPPETTVAEQPVEEPPAEPAPLRTSESMPEAAQEPSTPSEPDEAEPTPVAAVADAETEAVTEPVSANADDDTAAGDTENGDTAAGDDDGGRSAPLKRDDYVSASGSLRSIRPMQPRPSGGDSGGGRKERKSKERAKVSLPHLAAQSTFKVPEAPKPKAEEERAQKPTVRLADSLQKGSPLADHMRKHTDKRRGRDDEGPTETQDDRRGRGAAAGMGLADTREQRRQRRRVSQATREEDQESRSVVARRRRSRSSSAPANLKSSATIEPPITIRSLSEAIGRPAKAIIGILFQQGLGVTINSGIDEETAIEVCIELGVDLQVKRAESLEEQLLASLEAEDDPSVLTTRPPIVTILGHVDHGKTTLVDKLRSTNVVEGEAGGITQHIAAYQVDRNGHRVTFVDTPGHAAFGEMRARGANVTDIVVLVVAANDGVMPQTVECISHAKAAGVPIIVALNKVDLPDINEQKALQELAQHDVLPAEWGGDVEVVRTSGISGQGLDDLLETILLTAELQEFKANAEADPSGICLEGFRDEGRGPLAWLLVQRGTLRVGDNIVCGESFGRVRAMYNERDEELTEAGPSTPLMLAGFDTVPGAGEHFFVVSDVEQARQLAEDRHERGRALQLSNRGKPRTLEDILNAARDGEVQDLPIIVKADTPGSLEALRGEMEKLDHPEVRVTVLHEGVGGVNESDVYLASASGAIIFAFHVIAEDRAQLLAQQEGVDIRRYNIIYEVTAEIRRILEGLLKPERVEVATGRALVLQTFSVSRFGTIAGCRILNGTIDRSNRMHVVRDQKIINNYPIASLRREKDDVKEVREGMECGIRLDGFNDIKEGDLLEAYRIEEIKRSFDD